MKHLIQRFKAPTPVFWKKVRAKATKLGMGFTGAGTAIYQYQEHLPEIVVEIGKYATGTGVLIAATVIVLASLTVEDSATNEK